MNKQPTYTANEIMDMVSNCGLDIHASAILANIIDEELSLYSEDEMIIIMQASMKLFIRSLLMGSIKNLK